MYFICFVIIIFLLFTRRVSYNTFRTYEWCAQIMQDIRITHLHEIYLAWDT